MFLLAEGWVLLIRLASGGRVSLPFAAPLFAGMAWAALACVVIERWSRSSQWSDLHRLAAVLGAVAAVLSNAWQGKWLPGDIILRVVVSAAVILLIATLLRNEHKRQSQNIGFPASR